MVSITDKLNKRLKWLQAIDPVVNLLIAEPGKLPLCKVPRCSLKLGEKVKELLRGAFTSVLPTVQQVLHGLLVTNGTSCRVDMWMQTDIKQPRGF